MRIFEENKYKMKNKLLLVALACISLSSYAQTGYYQEPLSGTGNPGGLNADLEFPVGGGISAGWATLLAGPQSGTWTASQTIPFTFKFNDAVVTSYTVHTNGVLTFGGSAATIAAANKELPDAGIPDKSVCLWGLRASNTGDNVISKTFGTAPNRQHWIQFNSASEANLSGGASSGWCYMSIVLEETTNKIYIVDQRTNINNTSKISAGIQIDGSTALKVNGSHPFAAVNNNSSDALDNRYFAFVPGAGPSNEARLVSMDNAKFALIADAPFDITYTVGNNGSAAITELKVSYTIDGGTAVTDEITGLNIASGKTATVKNTTKWTPASIAKYDIVATIDEVNGAVDSNLSDNVGTTVTSIVDALVQRNVLHEVFTSSTCGPCKPGNENLNSIIVGKDNHTSVKYQMSWPNSSKGNGDPYYFAELATRRTYYGVNSIPQMQVDGIAWEGNAGTYTAGAFKEQTEVPSFMEITGSAKNEWKGKISCDITIDPKADYTSANMKVYAMIIEKETYWNLKTNGETKFENVVKKIMPGPGGDNLAAMTKDNPVNKSYSFTFTGYYRLPYDATTPINLNTEQTVENFDNLAVVVFVQDNATKEVFQSAMFDVASTGTKDISNKMNVYPNPAANQMLVNVKTLSNANSSVELINMMGQVVASGNTPNGQYTFDVSTISNGIYTVKMLGDSKQAIQKIVVKH